MIISVLILLVMRNVSDRVVEKFNTHISCSINYFSENRTVLEIMWKNMAEPDRPQMT